ncbi:unnamed protein product [Lactuca saligna]|uniref:NAC domain-containing protein n=1 Tax=Lactuca saligna TaxID=75948 RepID=A0AA35YX27_LACSI|nr:unnamed protein product [Lactuca saligna]
MCPPASSILPAAQLGDYLTDEGICKFLMMIKNGSSSLPDYILPDVDPFQFSPANYPENMWYFWAGRKRETEFGFWKSKGEACEIYSTPSVSGFRKTLEFYEGKSPDGQKTNWVMQKYTVTEKFISKPDPRALYKVFLVDESISGRLSTKSQLLEKNVDDVAGPSAMANDSPSGDFLELDDLAVPLPRTPDSGDVGDYVPRGGDYLEMDDLATPLSRTTSATDSSCMTMTSEEYFDSEALMRELEDDNGVQEIQESKIQLNLSVPSKLKEVVINTTTLGSVESDKDQKPSTTGPTSQNEPGGTSNATNKSPASSSSSEGSSSKEEKKDRVNRTKKRKVMKYLCFLAF